MNDVPHEINGRMLLTHVPEGSITLAVREAMKTAISYPDGAKKAGLSIQIYSFIRQIIILSEAEDRVPIEERNKLRAALRKIDAERVVVNARKDAWPIVHKYWVNRTWTGEKKVKLNADQAIREKQQHIFDNHVFQIRETCMATSEIEIPGLSKEARREAVDTIGKCIYALSMLLLRINTPQKEKPQEE